MCAHYKEDGKEDPKQKRRRKKGRRRLNPSRVQERAIATPKPIATPARPAPGPPGQSILYNIQCPACLDLNHPPYFMYGVKCIDPVSLAPGNDNRHHGC